MGSEIFFLLPEKKAIRAADAKEVGVGNPAEETYRYPNQRTMWTWAAERFLSTEEWWNAAVLILGWPRFVEGRGSERERWFV